MSKRMTAILAASALMALSGCAPVISQKVLDTADRKITFAELVKNPAEFTGKTVLVGGEIISAKNLKDRTEIEVLEMPLGYRLKPVDAEKSAGRFILDYRGFKDPAIYGAGRKITAVGTVEGVRAGKVNNMAYNYPVIKPEKDYLWRMEEYAYPPVGVGIGVGVIQGY